MQLKMSVFENERNGISSGRSFTDKTNSVHFFFFIFVFFLREGRSNAHVKGDYQRIGDVMLKNMCALKVGHLQFI